ncbi:hypothetical protein RRG08_036088 [Elysia crispata]|uniref:Uncharacterized protein n=1 Tax=Elysia crispata TaxID=231223 RepID=A0AAE1E165_9GAST|nr:hypothetical protein RRG08_036088 [Elysia crispata]
MCSALIIDTIRTVSSDTTDRKLTPVVAVNSRRSPTASRLGPEDLSPVGGPVGTETDTKSMVDVAALGNASTTAL